MFFVCPVDFLLNMEVVGQIEYMKTLPGRPMWTVYPTWAFLTCLRRPAGPTLMSMADTVLLVDQITVIGKHQDL